MQDAAPVGRFIWKQTVLGRYRAICVPSVFFYRYSGYRKIFQEIRDKICKVLHNDVSL